MDALHSCYKKYRDAAVALFNLPVEVRERLALEAGKAALKNDVHMNRLLTQAADMLAYRLKSEGAPERSKVIKEMLITVLVLVFAYEALLCHDPLETAR